MKTFISGSIAAVAICLIAPSARADLGSVHVFTQVQPEISDEIEEQFLKRLAAAHLHSPIGADHYHFFIRVDPSVKDDSYAITLGRAPHIDELAVSIYGNLAGINHALREIELAFKHGTLYELKSAWRKQPVKKPVLKEAGREKRQ